MGDRPHIPNLKSFVIAASILRQIDAQGDGPPKRIPIIICLKESAEHPELGVQSSREEVKKFLRDKCDQVTDSDFYVFASLFPDDIKKLAEPRPVGLPTLVGRNDLRPPAQFHGHGEGNIVLADV